MSAMSYELRQLYEMTGVTTDLFAARIAFEDGRRVPTVIIVTDSLSEEQEEKARAHLWGIAEILRSARATKSEDQRLVM